MESSGEPLKGPAQAGELAKSMEKIWVAIGSDLQEGFKTLEWILRKWPPTDNPMFGGIALVHVSHDISKGFVCSPLGKFPASLVNEEMLKFLKKQEQGKTDSLLHKYKVFCGEVKIEFLIIENPNQDPISNLLLNLICGHHMTKLVIDLTFIKPSPSSSSRKSRDAVRELLHLQNHKPKFCEQHIVHGGKTVHLREEDHEGAIEDDQGIIVKTRDKHSCMDWLGRIMFPMSNRDHFPRYQNDDPLNQWEYCVQEIDNYFQEVMSLQWDDSDFHGDTDNKEEALKMRIEEAQQMIKRKRIEAKTHFEGRLKAERTIQACNQWNENLAEHAKEERVTRVSLQKDLEVKAGQLQEALADTEESRRRLSLLAQVNCRLSRKLQVSMLSKSQAESCLENLRLRKGEVLVEIEDLQWQRDVLNQRIEFCREQEMVPVSSAAKCEYREYTAEDIRLATDDFSEHQRIKPASCRSNIYRGLVDYVTTVVIKMNHSSCGLSSEAFERKVRLLSEIRHPHVVAMLGFCLELKCIIFEFMHNGSLQDVLCKSNKRSGDLIQAKANCAWNLTPSHIFLDCNLTANLGNLALLEATGEKNVTSDVHALGHVVLHLLTGSSSHPGLFGQAGKVNLGVLLDVLDKRAGQWPWDLAEGLVKVAMRCLSTDEKDLPYARTSAIIEKLGRMRREAEALVTVQTDPVRICKDIMKNPHIASDGFSYELEAIKDWLWTGHETSPVTNSRLDHKFLTPNHILRSSINDWLSQQSRNTIAWRS
ncbi:hypothetical protein SAY87_011024 [Trapa incisa]|uniref:RING-type E3 ubiquitin transferase n=1 Tax=Trapa incisa TaxID=236973 RepID=A0AAN7JIG0_9MYRT|nr:hypothetical protein SAY87_011024 [Trapa incisa]